jgi:hypothetical protein
MQMATSHLLYSRTFLKFIQMISISIEQCSLILTLVEIEQKRVMIALSDSEDYKQTDILMTQRKKLSMLHDDLTYKMDNIDIEIEIV